MSNVYGIKKPRGEIAPCVGVSHIWPAEFWITSTPSGLRRSLHKSLGWIAIFPPSLSIHYSTSGYEWKESISQQGQAWVIPDGRCGGLQGPGARAWSPWYSAWTLHVFNKRHSSSVSRVIAGSNAVLAFCYSYPLRESYQVMGTGSPCVTTSRGFLWESLVIMGVIESLGIWRCF